MHQALRVILGTHVEQRGSMVHSGMFRFDFSHFAKVTIDEIKEVEQFVNSRIQEKIPLEESRNTPYDSAIKQGVAFLNKLNMNLILFKFHDPSKLPSEWWNYLVNPIVGYYIPKATLYKKQKN